MIGLVLSIFFTSSVFAQETRFVRGTWPNTSSSSITEEIGGFQTYPELTANIVYTKTNDPNLRIEAKEFDHIGGEIFERTGVHEEYMGYYISGKRNLNFGSWAVTKLGCYAHLDTCRASATFRPKISALEDIIDESRIVTVQVKISLAIDSSVSGIVSIVYENNRPIEVRWQDSFDGNIYAKGSNNGNNGSYSSRILDLRTENDDETELNFSVVETVDSQNTITTNPISNTQSQIISVEYGEWHIHQSQNCNVQKCTTVEFVPNQQAINERSQGKTIDITLTIELGDFAFIPIEKDVVVTIYGLPESTVELFPVSDSYINVFGRDINIATFGNNYDYTDISGQLTHYYHRKSSVQFSATEQVLGVEQSPIQGTYGTAMPFENENVHQLGTNFRYGIWHVGVRTHGTRTLSLTDGTQNFWFIPNDSAIKEIPINQTVRQTFTVTYRVSDGYFAPFAHQYIVEITRYPFVATLNFTSKSSNTVIVDEGDEIDLTVSLRPSPDEDTNVSIVAEDVITGTNFVGDLSMNPVVVGPSGVANLTLSTQVVKSHLNDGQIEVTLVGSPEVSYSGAGLEINVRNDVNPTISLYQSEYQEQIEEGENINLTLRAIPAPTKPVEVLLNMSELVASSGFLPTDHIESVTIGVSGLQEISIPTNIVKSHESNGKLTISLDSSPFYDVGTHSNSVAVEIINRITPLISIRSTETSITEGEEFSFQITATPAPELPMLVNFGVSESDVYPGYFHNVSIENPVEIPTSGMVEAIIDTNVLVSSHGSGVITVNLFSGERYDIDSQVDEVVVLVSKANNVQVPEVSLRPIAPTNSVDEGERFEIDLVATPAPSKPLTVSLEITETGTTTGYLSTSSEIIEQIIDINGSTRVSIATLKKLANELDGEFTISIIDHPAFTTSPISSELVVAVEDVLTPVISIHSDENGGAVAEGSVYSLTLHASPLPKSSVLVDLSIDDNNSGFFGGISVANPVEISNSGQATVEVTVNNLANEIANGQIDIAIRAATNDSYTVHETLNQISTSISDLVSPTVSIYSDFDNEEIIEGDGFTFRLEAAPAPIESLNVQLVVQDSGAGHFTTLPNGNLVTIGETGVLEITIDQTTVTSAYQNGQFDIAILASSESDYVKSSTHDAISIAVIDQRPIVSISSVQNNASIVEGASFTINIEAYPIPLNTSRNNLTVLLTYSNSSGHFVNFSTGNYVIIRPNAGELRGTAVVTINTRVLATQGDGQISVGIGSGFAYEISPTENAIAVDVKDQSAPVVSITSPEFDDGVVEGDSFTFILQSSFIPQSPFEVEFVVTKSDTGHLGEFTIDDPITTPLTSNRVTIGATGSRVVTVATNNVNSKIEHGFVTISLINRSASIYAISSSEMAVTIGIRDTVKPVISISSPDNEEVVVEGDSFTFTLTAVPAPQSAVFVQLTANDLGTNHFSGLPNDNSVEIGKNGVTEVVVSTDIDPLNLQHGEINISIDEAPVDSNYLVTPLVSEQSIHVVIKDSVTPTVSIAVVDDIDAIMEGETFNVILEANPLPLSPIYVDVDINDRGLHHFSGTSKERPVMLDPSGMTEFSVTTNNINEFIQHGRIDLVVTSENPTSYIPSLQHSYVSVGVKDRVKPVVSITSPENDMVLVEGAPYSFKLTAVPRPFAPLVVNLENLSTNTNHFVAFADNDMVEIGLDGTTIIAATTLHNTNEKSNGEIIIALTEVGDYAEYEVAELESEKSIQIRIADFIVPEISINSGVNGQSVIEGEEIELTINSDIEPLAPIQVGMNVASDISNHFVSFVPSNSITMQNTNSAALSISTQVVAGFAHGEISVSINDPIEAQFTINNSASSIAVGIRDNELPVVSLSTTYADEVITEGDSFTFTLIAIPAPYAPIMIDLTALDFGTNHLIDLSESSQIEIGTSGSKQVTVETQNTTDDIQNSEITIGIDEVANSFYQAATLAVDREFRVIVKDSEIPVVSISASKNNQGITEGESFIFRLESVPAPINPLMVELDITESIPGYLNRISTSNPVMISSDGATDITVYTNQTSVRELSQIDIEIIGESSGVFEKSTTDGAISVEIKDQIKSVVSITSNQDNGVITEGEEFTLSLTALPAPLEPIFVDITATDSGTNHFAQLSEPSPVEIGIDGESLVTVLTNQDATNVQHGAINIAIDDMLNPNYEVTSEIADQSIQVTVKDQEAPVVSISPVKNGESITEGESFEFTLTANPVPLTPIVVNLTAEDRGTNHFQGIDQSNPITIDESGVNVVTVRTQNDEDALTSGWIDITVNGGDEAQYNVDETSFSISVRVLDAVVPVITISSPVEGLVITEGESFDVTLMATPQPLEPIMVNFTVRDEGTGHFGEIAEIDSVEIGRDGVKTITINSTAIEDRIEHGAIDFLVNQSSDQSYTLADPESPPNIRVLVRDIVTPVVAISSSLNGGFVNEGEDISYQLVAIPSPVTPLTIYLGMTSTPVGQIDQDSFSNPVVIGTSGEFNGTISTNNLVGITKHGNVEVTLVDSNGVEYAVSPTQQTISVQIRDRVQPVVSIISENINDGVLEGDNIRFRIQASPAPFTPIQINLNIQDELNSGHLKGLSSDVPVVIGTNGRYEGVINTNNLSDQIGHGRISVTIEESSGYAISTNARAIAISVIDRTLIDVPEVFVTPSQTSITDGGIVDFTFTAIPVPEEEIRVNILVAQQNSAVQWKVPRSITMRSSKTISVNIRQVENIEFDGEVSVTVLAGENYRANEQVARVTVQRQEKSPIIEPEVRNSVANSVAQQLLSMLEVTANEPVVAIAALKESVVEGTPVQFKITANQVVTRDISLYVNQVGNFLVSTPPLQVAMINQQEFIYELDTVADELSEANGSITVSLVDGEGYTVLRSASSTTIEVVSSITDNTFTEQVSAGLQAGLPTIFATSNKIFTKNTLDRIHSSLNNQENKNFTIRGNLDSFDLIQKLGQGLNQNNFDLRDLLDNVSFVTGTSSRAGENIFSLWGFSDYHDIDSDIKFSENTLNGEMFVGQLGFDARINEEIFAGIGITSTNSTFTSDFKDISDIQYWTSLVGLQPYFGYLSAEHGLELNTAIGIGVGEVEVSTPHYSIDDIDTNQLTVVMNGRAPLYSISDKQNNSNTEINVLGSAEFSQQSIFGNEEFSDHIDLTSKNIRFAFEASHSLESAEKSVFNPWGTIGLVSRDNFVSSKVGINFSSGVEYSHPFGLNLKSFGTLQYDGLYKTAEWYLNGNLSFDLDLDERGIYASITADAGNLFQDKNGNFCESTISDNCDLIGFSQLESSLLLNHFEYKIGFIYELNDTSTIIPQLKLDFSDNSLTELSYGGKYSISSFMNLNLLSTQTLNSFGSSDQSFKLDGNLKW